MLPRDDMFDVKTQRGELLRQMAILAPLPGTLANQLADSPSPSGRFGVGEKSVGINLEHTEQ